jgi:hypothetical protein
MSILTNIASVQTNLAELIVDAGPFADRMILEIGAAPVDDEDYDRLTLEYLKATIDEGHADLADLLGGLSKDDYERVIDGIMARDNAFYALGVAVGLRLERALGGAR